MGFPAVLVAVLMGVTCPGGNGGASAPVVLTMYAVLPLGVITMDVGSCGTFMGGPAVLVAVLIGVTVCEYMLATW